MTSLQCVSLTAHYLSWSHRLAFVTWVPIRLPVMMPVTPSRGRTGIIVRCSAHQTKLYGGKRPPKQQHIIYIAVTMSLT